MQPVNGEGGMGEIYQTPSKGASGKVSHGITRRKVRVPAGKKSEKPHGSGWSTQMD